ncbi:hypothetical protein ANN_26394 [Periplaneta americana]|uniref:CRAL-TRIO domain-containing protein n=1 Tax=Periplaneta americana TaxID=6978 RepID=A0ABQ8RXY7_PERAM|nr:hypothetical protein ANN_26394 [Periplaneta americana]
MNGSALHYSTRTKYLSRITQLHTLRCNADRGSFVLYAVVLARYFTAMPRMTPEYDRVVCFGFLSNDPTDLVIEDWYRIAMMTIEVRMCEDYSLRDIFIMDLANYTLAHVSKFSFLPMKKAKACCVKAFSTRLKALHIINAPPFAGVLVELIKSVFSTKLAARIPPYCTVAVGTCSWDRPHRATQASPKGESSHRNGRMWGSIIANWNPWLKKLETYQDWFLQHENVKSDEKKRIGGNPIGSDLFGFEGSFRKLDVD